MTIGTPDISKQKIDDLVLKGIDQSVVNWFSKEFPIDFDGRKVPVIYVSMERWALFQQQKVFRDNNGVIILPLISVRRLESTELYERYVPKRDETRITFKRKIATSDIDGKERLPFDSDLMNNPIYEVYSAEFPTFIKLNYAITLHTSFLSHANVLQENIWKKGDAGRFYFKNDGYLLFSEFSGSRDESNVDDFVDEKRILRYQYNFSVHCPLIDHKDVKITRTFTNPKIIFKEG